MMFLIYETVNVQDNCTFLLKHVKFQHNNTMKHNFQYSVCAEISQGMNNLDYHYLNSQCELSDHVCPPAN